MSHTSFVQQAQVEAVSSDKGIHGSLTAIGLLGCDEQYSMPCPVLEALAGHLGGMVVTDLPPFFVACKDGLVLVLTLAVGEEYVGSAFVLPVSELETVDPRIAALWGRANKTQTSEEFFQGTAFQRSGTSCSFPQEARQFWRFANN